MLTRVLATQVVNIAMGGAVIGPGDIDDLQDELIDACKTIVQEVPRLRQASKPPRGKR